MDRRLLRNKLGLHKNLHRTKSQLSISSSTSNCSFPDKPLYESSPMQKRKISDLSSDNDSSELEASSVIKPTAVKKRQKLSSKEADLATMITEELPASKRAPSGKTLNSQNSLGRQSANKNDSPLLNKTKRNKGLQVRSVSSNAVRIGNEFCNFLEASGITMESMGIYKISTEPSTVIEKMKCILKSARFKKEEIITSMEQYVKHEENLRNIINNFDIPVNHETFNGINNVSVVTVLLQISELQADVLRCLLHKLNECVLIADSIEKLPWACPLLQQLRFLEILIDSDSLIKNLEQLLHSSPTWFQHELILLLPDIAPDSQHYTIFQIVGKLIDDNLDLINSVLDCITSLTVSQACVDEYRDKVLTLLKRNLKPNVVPAIIRFLLTDCTNVDVFKKILITLRSVDMQPLIGDNLDECCKNQIDVVTALKMNLLLSKEMVQATVAVTKSVTKDPKPLDIILLLLLFPMGAARKKSVEAILKNHVRTGLYRPSLLRTLYNDYKEIVRDLQTSVLLMASFLLNAEERIFVDFAVEWFRLQFLSQADSIYKQREIIEKIILFIGCNDRSAKNALKILSRISRKTDERYSLQVHSNHLRILLEKVDNLNLEEVGMLNDLLHALCLNRDSASESLRVDLFILLQKQLSNVKPLIKGKGILGTVMAIKHLAGSKDSCNMAYEMFGKVLAAVREYPKSQALFYDELTQVLAQTENIQNEFLQNVVKYVEEEFVKVYMIEKSAYSGELTSKFGLNSGEDGSQSCVLYFNKHKCGAIVPITFKLLKTCCLRLSENGSLDDIDALLGSPVLMPESIDIPEPFVLDLTINCINWFRELIAGFVTQKDPLLQKQLLKRLSHLMQLQNDLNNMLAISDTKYRPSPCYFNYFPTPPFLRVEKKVMKKGKKEKLIHTSEEECWETDAKLFNKNPAYFRKLDAKIAHLLDINMTLDSSQPSMHGISIIQVCFVVKELLGMIDNETSEVIMRDLINLLPKVCVKLVDVVSQLREKDNAQSREAAKLLLYLLAAIFNWKGFQTATYNNLLRDGLRILASLLDEANSTLRSSKELVTESCKYIDSISDIATRIPLAIALISTCQSLMKHSETYVQQYKEKHAKIAFGFLCLQWTEDKRTGPGYRNAIALLLNNWIDNEPDPLSTVTVLLEWLPDEAVKLQKPQDNLNRLPSINRAIFHLLYKKIFDGIIKGVKVATSTTDKNRKRVETWQNVAKCIQGTVKICKILKTKSNVLTFLRCMPIIVRLFLNSGMPVLERNLKYQTEDITQILKAMQSMSSAVLCGTRQLHAVCCDCTERKNVTLTKYVPIAKAALEKLVFSVKGMLVLNNSAAAFWMGNLVNKNLDGIRISSRMLSSPSSANTIIPSDANSDDLTNASSEVLDSDVDEDNVEIFDNNDNIDTSDNDSEEDETSCI